MSVWSGTRKLLFLEITYTQHLHLASIHGTTCTSWGRFPLFRFSIVVAMCQQKMTHQYSDKSPWRDLMWPVGGMDGLLGSWAQTCKTPPSYIEARPQTERDTKWCDAYEPHFAVELFETQRYKNQLRHVVRRHFHVFEVIWYLCGHFMSLWARFVVLFLCILYDNCVPDTWPLEPLGLCLVCPFCNPFMVGECS